MYHVQADGWVKISADDMNDLYWEKYSIEDKKLIPKRD